jgi:hypothetical protein
MKRKLYKARYRNKKGGIMKKLLDLKLLGLVAILTVALVFIGVDFIKGQATTQGKPDKPPGKKGEDGHLTHDMPAITVFLDLSTDAVRSDGEGPYIDDIDRVTCFIGRRAGQFVLTTAHKYTSGRMLCVDDTNVIPSPPPPIPPNPSSYLGDCRVAEMATGGEGDSPVLPRGVDLRFMTAASRVGMSLILFDDRQNLWRLIYGEIVNDELEGGVLVTPKDFDPNRDVDGDGEADAVEWEITTDGDGSPTAILWWNLGWNDPIYYGPFEVPFHLTVRLKSAE